MYICTYISVYAYVLYMYVCISPYLYINRLTDMDVVYISAFFLEEHRIEVVWLCFSVILLDPSIFL